MLRLHAYSSEVTRSCKNFELLLCQFQEEKLLTTYLELYDIVLTGDASMDVVNAIVGVILTGNSY